jgi:hypothetical protein
VVAKAEDVAPVWKVELNPPRERLRILSSQQVCDLARMVELAMGCSP